MKTPKPPAAARYMDWLIRQTIERPESLTNDEIKSCYGRKPRK